MEEHHEVDAGYCAWSCRLAARYRRVVHSTAKAAHLHPSCSEMVLRVLGQGCLQSAHSDQQALLHEGHSWACSFSYQAESLVLMLVLPFRHFKSQM